jgi:hypothetical protein
MTGNLDWIKNQIKHLNKRLKIKFEGEINDISEERLGMKVYLKEIFTEKKEVTTFSEAIKT